MVLFREVARFNVDGPYIDVEDLNDDDIMEITFSENQKGNLEAALEKALEEGDYGITTVQTKDNVLQGFDNGGVAVVAFYPTLANEYDNTSQPQIKIMTNDMSRKSALEAFAAAAARKLNPSGAGRRKTRRNRRTRHRKTTKSGGKSRRTRHHKPAHKPAHKS